MNQFTQSISDLKNLYDVTEPYYLSTLLSDGGNASLHNFLTSVHQDEYQNNFRILIVQDCVDIYDYQDLPGQSICTLQKYASQIDISNFFILIITGNKDINKELEQARILYSTDNNKMQSLIIDDMKYVVNTPKKDTFCVLPWMHLYVGTDGNILPCCVADHQHPMGNIKEDSIDNIIKSPTFNQLRLNMLNGKRSKECSRCYAQEDLSIHSARMSHNSQWANIRVADLDPTGNISSFSPAYIDIRLSNVCNLKCRMCSGYFSSAIAAEDAELFDNKKYIETSMQFRQREHEITNILKYLPTCEKIYFAGGEPLLSHEHYTILNKLILCGNTDLELTYNTNFTTLKYRDQSVLDLWKNFSNIKVGASLDAQGVVAEYVRHGTTWKDIEFNLQQLKSQCPHVDFMVTSTVGLLNVSSLIDLQKNWHISKMLNISKFSQSIMIGPTHLTLSALPVEHKNRLDSMITDHISWCQDNDAHTLAKQWNNALTYMWSEDASFAITEFKRLTKIVDQHRNESLSNVLPEYNNLL
jgi:radical SAM protein with 4Fe4S-binding SPASM domain